MEESELIETLAKELYIEFGFKFYGRDGEPTTTTSRQGRNADGELNGVWTTTRSGDCGIINREAAKELWETGKYDIDDYDGDDFHFTCDVQTKEIWKEKAKKLLTQKEKAKKFLAHFKEEHGLLTKEDCQKIMLDILIKHETFNDNKTERRLIAKIVKDVEAI